MSIIFLRKESGKEFYLDWIGSSPSKSSILLREDGILVHSTYLCKFTRRQLQGKYDGTLMRLAAMLKVLPGGDSIDNPLR